MKREILFRGKRVKDGKWVEGLLTKDIKGHIRIQYNPRYFSVVVNPESVGQFTGMTDKNGTKIFEGDIVKEQYKAYERIYNVFWDEDYFVFRAKSKDYSYHLDEIIPSHCEVIGNVFENKEILK